MDERCAQFATDAQRPRDGKTRKEIAKLQKFLFRNQEHRFTERAQSHLFSAVQTHVANHSAAPLEDDNPALPLVEDALKMPFTVFSTSQKKTMMKWLAKLTPSSGASDAGTSPRRVISFCPSPFPFTLRPNSRDGIQNYFAATA